MAANVRIPCLQAAADGRIETKPILHRVRQKAVTGSRIASMWSTDSGESGQYGRNPQNCHQFLGSMCLANQFSSFSVFLDTTDVLAPVVKLQPG